MNTGYTYCDGVGCGILRERCRRFVVGQLIKQNRDGDTAQHYWMEHCDVETRELYAELRRGDGRLILDIGH